MKLLKLITFITFVISTVTNAETKYPKTLTSFYAGIKPLYFLPKEEGQAPTGMAVDLFNIATKKMGIIPKLLRARSAMSLQLVFSLTFM